MKTQHFYFSPQFFWRGVVLKLSCLSDSHGPSTYTGHACVINYQTILYQWGSLAYPHEWSDLHIVWFLHVTFSCPWVPYIYRMKKLDKSVVSRQSCRGYRMLKGTRQWACCRLGSQNARWRAISTAHHPLYPGYGNGTWNQSLDDRPRPGREKVMTPEQDQYIVTQHLRDRFRTATQTAAETPGIRQPRISASTVRRRLHQVNLSATLHRSSTQTNASSPTGSASLRHHLPTG